MLATRQSKTTLGDLQMLRSSMPPPQPLLFINRDAKSIGQRSRNEIFEINFHVKNKYRIWRNKQRLSASAGNTECNVSDGHSQDYFGRDNQVACTHGYQRKEKTHEPAISLGLAEIKDFDIEDPPAWESRSFITVSHERPYRSPSPLAILKKGSSDPFNTRGVAITPFVNEIMTFVRDFVTPGFYFTEFLQECSATRPKQRQLDSTDWVSATAAQQSWQSLVWGLDDRCTALACLSTYLTIMTVFKQNTAPILAMIIQMKTESTALLRRTLESRVEIPSEKTNLSRVFWHFCAESVVRDKAAARIHGTMLRSLFEQASRRGLISEQFILQVLFFDTDLAVKTMTRPVFDPEHWIPSFFERNWSTAAPSLPVSVLDCESGLDESIATQPLCDVFALNRQLIEICSKPLPLNPKSGLNANSCFIYVGSKSHWGMCRLVNHYLNLTDSQSEDGSHSLFPGHTKGQLFTEATITLAAIHTIRLIGYEVKVNGINIRDASPTILTHLRSSLNHA
jgi:hypothetical protein